jgi:spore maturation protein CgeB
MDDPFQSTLQRVLASFDSLYVVDESWIAPIQLLTGRGAAMLPCGGDLQSYHPVGWEEIPAAARSKVAFVGTSYSAQPAGLVRRTLLGQVADLGLSIYGDKGWAAGCSRDDPLPKCYRGGQLTSEQANLVYNGASIGLNIHHSQFRAGTSLRTFAICASGAFQLVDWRPGLERFFVPDKEVVMYRSPDELREKVLYYLANKSARRRIARAGCQRVEREHTYGHRMRRILRDTDLCWGLSSGALFRLSGAFQI